MTKSRGVIPFSPRRPWLDWEIDLIIELYPVVETSVVSWFLCRGQSGIYNLAWQMGLKKDPQTIIDVARERSLQPDHPMRAHYFKKGFVPANKGQRGYHAPGSEKGWFKKGHQRSNTAPIGAERIDSKDGYVLIKVSSAVQGKKALAWQPKHRVLWEQSNGPVPDGMRLRCIDKNILNCAPDNWELITHGQNMQRNSIHNYPRDIVYTTLLRAAINRRINANQQRQASADQPAGERPD